MRFSKNQKVALLAGTLAAVGMGIFPPWIMEGASLGTEATSIHFPLGYNFHFRSSNFSSPSRCSSTIFVKQRRRSIGHAALACSMDNPPFAFDRDSIVFPRARSTGRLPT